MIAQDKKYKTGSRCVFGNGIKKNNWRIFFLAGIILVAVFVIIARLYVLQVLSYDSFKQLADSQHTLSTDLTPKRGEIFFKDKDNVYPAAVNRGFKMAFAVPNEIEDKDETARKISEALQLDRMDLQDRFSRPNDMYEVLKHKLSDDEVNKINALKLSGIYMADEYFRYYPSGELAANVLGFVGWRGSDFAGRYGIEAYYDDELKGVAGTISQNRDGSGRWISTGIKNLVKAKDGDSLVLTVDHIIQYQVERILKNAVEKFAADGGNVTVMDPNTGKILAMASYPTFDPNDYSQVEDISAFRDQPVNDAYEPGSVFKAFTIAAGLDSGLISPNSGYTIHNSDLKANGVQTMTNVLEKSLNTGVIYVEKQLGNKNFADYVRRFGFGEQTGVDLLAETGGNVRNIDNLKSNIQFFTVSFGQGLTVTPIQLAAAYGAIANGGTLMKPEIVDKIIHADGSEDDMAPIAVRRVISAEAASEDAGMLRSVVTNGHGKQADVPGYLVAGKTGTAQVASADSRGYAQGKSIGSFAGFAPVGNPKFTMVVSLSDPKNVEWAESSAAPVFGELMKFLLEYYNIEPTENYEQKTLDKFDQVHNLAQYVPEKSEEESDKANTALTVPASDENNKKK